MLWRQPGVVCRGRVIGPRRRRRRVFPAPSSSLGQLRRRHLAGKAHTHARACTSISSWVVSTSSHYRRERARVLSFLTMTRWSKMKKNWSKGWEYHGIFNALRSFIFCSFLMISASFWALMTLNLQREIKAGWWWRYNQPTIHLIPRQ